MFFFQNIKKCPLTGWKRLLFALYSFFSFSAIWLGGTQTLSLNGEWKWSDDTCWLYTNWNSGEPNNGGGGEDCMATAGGSSSAWNDLSCSTSLSYLCELDGKFSIRKLSKLVYLHCSCIERE